MNFEGEYIFKVKIGNVVVSEEYSEDELKNKLLSKGRQMMMDYFNNILFDPEHKVFFEEISYKEKQYD